LLGFNEFAQQRIENGLVWKRSIYNCLNRDSSPTAWVRNDTMLASIDSLTEETVCQILHPLWGFRMTEIIVVS
jgi:hypothetical protein